MLSNLELDALLKTGDPVGLVVAAIFFSQVFEKTAKELVKIRCRYVCYVKTAPPFSLAIGAVSLAFFVLYISRISFYSGVDVKL